MSADFLKAICHWVSSKELSSSVGVQHKSTMGEAGIKQGLYLVLRKPPAPSEI